MTAIRAPGFPEAEVRARARHGTAEAFPPADAYGVELLGAGHDRHGDEPDRYTDELDRARLVPPIFMPQRLEKLIDLGREPLHDDVDLRTVIGGFRSRLPVFVAAFGSTRLVAGDLGIAASRQAGRLGIPMVVGENIVPVHGYRPDGGAGAALLARIRAYVDEAEADVGGVVVQQSTEDADAEVWHLVYSDPSAQALLRSGRLAFELKVGQGAKPGLGGTTVIDEAEALRLAGRFAVRDVFGAGCASRLRCASPGTFTDEIVRQQVRFMHNNFPEARVWVKYHPGRDVAEAARTAWRAGADAVTVDGAEGGTGWAPRAFLGRVGLPLAECLHRIGRPAGCLLATGRMWEGGRLVRSLAMGATAVGLGRAALVAVDEDPDAGLVRLAQCLALETQLLVSALGRYSVTALTSEDLWWPGSGGEHRPGVRSGTALDPTGGDG